MPGTTGTCNRTSNTVKAKRLEVVQTELKRQQNADKLEASLIMDMLMTNHGPDTLEIILRSSLILCTGETSSSWVPYLIAMHHGPRKIMLVL